MGGVEHAVHGQASVPPLPKFEPRCPPVVVTASTMNVLISSHNWASSSVLRPLISAGVSMLGRIMAASPGYPLVPVAAFREGVNRVKTATPNEATARTCNPCAGPRDWETQPTMGAPATQPM